MREQYYKSLIVYEVSPGRFERKIISREFSDLPDGDVVINVKYSSLNYKDALSSIGNKGITKRYPHTPGIDAAGYVVCSSNALFKQGDKGIVTGYDLGMNTAGGFAEYIRVPADWIIKLPSNLTLRESMAYGTAGFTSAVSLCKLEQNGLTPDRGDVLVTGATGGVGCVAVALLAQVGYRVVAVTGKMDQRDFLYKIGAKEVIERTAFVDRTQKSMLREKWAGVIDTVGGEILTSALKSTKRDGSVTCCGIVASNVLDMTLYPFILRGINLLGISVNQISIERKRWIWQKLASDWKIDSLDFISKECSLRELSPKIDTILCGESIGRTVVNLSL